METRMTSCSSWHRPWTRHLIDDLARDYIKGLIMRELETAAKLANIIGGSIPYILAAIVLAGYILHLISARRWPALTAEEFAYASVGLAAWSYMMR